MIKNLVFVPHRINIFVSVYSWINNSNSPLFPHLHHPHK